MKEYFYKKEYKYIYLGKTCYNFANSLIENFGTVMLYKAGVPIWLILLIYGLRFGIMGLSTPLFVKISSKFGIAICILISNFFSILSAYLMLDSSNIYRNILIFIITMGLLGISNPSGDSLSAKYVDKEHKGRFNSFLNITKIFAQALSSVFVAWGVITDNNLLLFPLIAIFFTLEYVFIKQIDYKVENKKGILKKTINYLFTSKSRYKKIYGLKTNHIIERQFVPLYLYIVLKDFKLFSSVVIISLLLQIISVWLIGKYSDKNLKNSNNLVSIIKTIITGIFLVAKDKITISINKTLNDNFLKVYETSIQTSIQNIIKDSKEDSDLLAAIGQMSLCFTEVIVFAILAIISKFINEKVFIVIFILSMLSSLLINIEIKKEEKELKSNILEVYNEF